jgi:hypothetical protein
VESVQPVSQALPPRNLIRALTAFAALVTWYCIISLAVETDWAPLEPADWFDVIIPVLMLLWLAAFCAQWTLRALRRPDGTTDRIVTLICVFFAISIPFEIVTLLLPEMFFDTFFTITLLFLVPVSYWTYRKLEVKWSADNEIHPLDAGVVWPTDRHFWVMTCLFFWMAWLQGVVSQDDDLPENFSFYYGALLSLAATVLVYQLGKRLLK